MPGIPKPVVFERARTLNYGSKGSLIEEAEAAEFRELREFSFDVVGMMSRIGRERGICANGDPEKELGWARLSAKLSIR
jgi:hypothetical protein